MSRDDLILDIFCPHIYALLYCFIPLLNGFSVNHQELVDLAWEGELDGR